MCIYLACCVDLENPVKIENEEGGRGRANVTVDTKRSKEDSTSCYGELFHRGGRY